MKKFGVLNQDGAPVGCPRAVLDLARVTFERAPRVRDHPLPIVGMHDLGEAGARARQRLGGVAEDLLDLWAAVAGRDVVPPEGR